MRNFRLGVVAIVLALGAAAVVAHALAGANSVAAVEASFPDPVADDTLATKKGQETIVLAGGCFWGVEAVFEHVRGVIDVTSGYSGGSATTAWYEMVSSGTTGHAESVKITYDPSQISYGRLLKVFFSVAHDPTQLNYQGPDTGTQYRSAIFYSGETQQRLANGYIDQLNAAGMFRKRIVTQIVPLQSFYPAEAYHQDFVVHNPFNPYIMMYDRPKVDDLRTQYPGMYVKGR